jgi:hypothetical protein
MFLREMAKAAVKISVLEKTERMFMWMFLWERW